MFKSKYNLEKILPHKAPMILLDDIVDYSLEKQILTAMFRVYPEKILYDDRIQGINSLSGLEFMAQAIGCYSHFKNGCKEPKPGLLLGTRLFNNAVDKFELNAEYSVEVQESFSDDKIYAFDCRITDKKNNDLQNACIKVYKSDDIEDIIKNG